jgi:thioredoxin-like negative regulator of GroEL
MAPAAERVEAIYQGQLDLQKVDVDKSPQLAADFNVRGVPTLVLTREGEVVAREVGAMPLSALMQWLDRYLAT